MARRNSELTPPFLQQTLLLLDPFLGKLQKVLVLCICLLQLAQLCLLSGRRGLPAGFAGRGLLLLVTIVGYIHDRPVPPVVVVVVSSPPSMIEVLSKSLGLPFRCCLRALLDVVDWTLDNALDWMKI